MIEKEKRGGGKLQPGRIKRSNGGRNGRVKKKERLEHKGKQEKDNAEVCV